MLKAMTDLNAYKIPTKKIRDQRKVFYDLHRNDAEPSDSWLKRVECAVNRCEFPVFAKFLLIDKFMCELTNDEIELILQSDVRRRTWSYKQLREFIFNPRNDVPHIELKTSAATPDNEQPIIPLDIVKTEPVSQSIDKVKFSFNRRKKIENITSTSNLCTIDTQSLFQLLDYFLFNSSLFPLQIDDEWAQQNELLDEVNYLLESAAAFTEKMGQSTPPSPLPLSPPAAAAAQAEPVAAAPKASKAPEPPKVPETTDYDSDSESDTSDRVSIDGIKFEVVSSQENMKCLPPVVCSNCDIFISFFTQDTYAYPVVDAAEAVAAVAATTAASAGVTEEVNSSSNTNANARSYACDRCDKTFAIHRNLRRHYSVHTGSC